MMAVSTHWHQPGFDLLLKADQGSQGVRDLAAFHLLVNRALPYPLRLCGYAGQAMHPGSGGHYSRLTRQHLVIGFS